jgi:hypothetical protein
MESLFRQKLKSHFVRAGKMSPAPELMCQQPQRAIILLGVVVIFLGCITYRRFTVSGLNFVKLQGLTTVTDL